MKHAVVFGTLVLLALSSGNVAASDSDAPLWWAPLQGIVHAGNRHVFVTVAAIDTPAPLRPRASLIIYAPDDTTLKPNAKLLRATGTATFRMSLGTAPQDCT